MDRNPERITFDPFVLPYETPQDIFFLSSPMFYDTPGYAGLLDGFAAGVSSTFLYIHICTRPIWLGK
jgi:hypothetical protein